MLPNSYILMMCVLCAPPGVPETILSGRVHCQEHALADVTLHVQTLDGRISDRVLSDALGHFQFAPLPRDQAFHITAVREGFQTVKRTIVPEKEGWFLKLRMTAAVDEQMVVQETPDSYPDPVIRLEGEQLQRLPSTRDVEGFLEWLPGTPDGSLFFGGSSVDNVFMLDGGEAGDPRTHEWDTPINVDAIETLQAGTNVASAEFRGGQGVLLNVVTRRGDNQFGGSLRHIRANASWNKTDTFGREYGLTEKRVALTVGGPVRKDRLWFFTSLETRGSREGNYYYDNLQDYTEHNQEAMVVDPIKNAGYYFMGKLNWRVNHNQDLELVVHQTPLASPHFQEANIANRDMGKRKLATDNYLLNWDWRPTGALSVSSTLQVKDRVFIIESDQVATFNQPLQQIVVPGRPNFHPQHSAPLSQRDIKEQTRLFKANALYDRALPNGRLTLKGGLEFSEKTSATAWLLSNWVYWGTDGSATLVDYDDPTPWREAREDYLGLYLQAQWEIGDHWQFNAGLRLEDFRQENAQGTAVVDAALGDLAAPRVGAVFRTGPYTLTASMGRYYGLTMHYAAFNSSDHDFARQDYGLGLSMDELETMGLTPWLNGEDWRAVSPENRPDLWEPTGGNIYIEPGLAVSEPLRVPYTDAYALSLERTFAHGFSMGLRLMHRAWYDSYENTDLDHDGIRTLEPFQQRWRTYKGAVFSLEKKAGDHPLYLNLTYTRSEALGFSQWGQLSFYQDSHYQIHNHVNGRASNYPNQLKCLASYVFAKRFTLGASSQWRDGSTWTPIIKVKDLIPGSATQGRWLNSYYEPRGSRTLEDFTRTDLHMAYAFPSIAGIATSLSLDIRNVFNQQRDLWLDRYIGYGRYDTDAEVGGEAWLDYVHTHAPVLETPRERFGTITSYSSPRSFLANLAVKF